MSAPANPDGCEDLEDPAPQDDADDAARQAAEKKRKSNLTTGSVLLVLGTFSAFIASNEAKKAASDAEALGGWMVPVALFAVGFYLFFKGGGKAV